MNLESPDLLTRKGYILGVFGHLICCCFPRIFPDLIGAFGFIVGPIFYVANAGVFGSVASASSWEPFQVAITTHAMAYFFYPDLVAKHDWLLQKLCWSDVSSPPGNTTVVCAQTCIQHNGVFDSADNCLPTKHNIYVYPPRLIFFL